jgi:hypothetical protein
MPLGFDQRAFYIVYAGRILPASELVQFYGSIIPRSKK